MQKNEILSLIFRSLLSLVALVWLLYLLISNHCKEIDTVVVIILWGTILGMNWKEVVEVYLTRKKW